jgi:hypothetical protein
MAEESGLIPRRMIWELLEGKKAGT